MQAIAVIMTPMSDERSIAHVGLFDLMARGDADELRHQSIHHIGIVLRLIGFTVRQEAELHQFGIRHIIKAEEIGTGFLNRIAISL